MVIKISKCFILLIRLINLSQWLLPCQYVLLVTTIPPPTQPTWTVTLSTSNFNHLKSLILGDFILLILACHSRVLVYLLISIPPPTQPTTVWLSSVCPLSVILLNDFPGLLSTLHTWLVLIILNIVMPVLCLYLCTVNTVNQTNNQVSVLPACCAGLYWESKQAQPDWADNSDTMQGRM